MTPSSTPPRSPTGEPAARRGSRDEVERDFARAHAQRDARAVDGDVAAADDEHALALHAGIALPVAVAQEVERADDALSVRAGDRDDAALLQTRRDEHGVVLADEVVDRHVLAHRAR